MRSVVAASAVLLLCAASAPTLAQTADSPAPADTSDDAPTTRAAPSPFTVTGSAAIASQYRFRGISQSDNKPVVQGSVTVAHSSGFYVSAWGSSASGDSAVNIGGTEIDVYGGYARALGKSGVVVDAGLYGYIYPGSKDAVGISESYYEVYGSLARSVGPVTAKAGLYWAPDQAYFADFHTRSHYDIYGYGELSIAPKAVPITVHVHLGHTGGGLDYAAHPYFDYTVGTGYKWKALTFDVSLVGTNLSRADTRPADLAAATDDYRRAAKPVGVASVTASF